MIPLQFEEAVVVDEIDLVTGVEACIADDLVEAADHVYAEQLHVCGCVRQLHECDIELTLKGVVA